MGGAIRHLTIRGRVQGVGYRAWVEHRARAHGLEGWVRNRQDGSVEVVLAGPDQEVADFIDRCRRGPSTARGGAAGAGPAGRDALNLRRSGERFSVLPTV